MKKDMMPITKRMRMEDLQGGIRLVVDPFGSSEAVSVAASFAGGKNLETKPLIAALAAFMLGEGTRKRSKREIQIFLDSIGASRNYEGQGDRIEVSGRVRATHLGEFLELLAEEIREPLFGEQEFHVLKERTRGALQREAQDTKRRAEVGLSRLMYEAGHPNRERDIAELGRALTAAKRIDLVEHHRKTAGKAELLVVLSGAVSFERAREQVMGAFGSLPSGARLKRRAVRKPAPKSAMALIPVAHKTNVDYLVGIRTGIGNEHPDFDPLLVGVRVLGNPGFTGRLIRKVREKEGLTYVVYSYLKGFGDFSDGHIMVWGAFAPQLLAKGRTSILREVKKLVAGGVTPGELRLHKRILADGWHVRLSNTSARANAILDTLQDGLPLSYLDTFPARIGKLTRSQVNAALRKYLIPSKLAEAAAGPVDSIRL